MSLPDGDHDRDPDHWVSAAVGFVHRCEGADAIWAPVFALQAQACAAIATALAAVQS